jgi:hypothetical protein
MFEKYYVTIKYVPENEFSEENLKKNLTDMNWLEVKAREHFEVIGRIMESGSVIPFNFGTIYFSKDNLKEFISDYSISLDENFQFIKGMQEWSVKIYCDRKSLIGHIDEWSEEAAAMEKQIMASAPGKAFLFKIKKNGLIENEVDRLCKSFGQQYFNEFSELCESSSLNNLLPKELTGREDTMILNATFLVSNKKVAEFINIEDRQRKKEKDSGFSIKISGPWAPSSFVSLKENANAG